jgi:hypothetical protein
MLRASSRSGLHFMKSRYQSKSYYISLPLPLPSSPHSLSPSESVFLLSSFLCCPSTLSICACATHTHTHTHREREGGRERERERQGKTETEGEGTVRTDSPDLRCVTRCGKAAAMPSARRVKVAATPAASARVRPSARSVARGNGAPISACSPSSSRARSRAAAARDTPRWIAPPIFVNSASLDLE